MSALTILASLKRRVQTHRAIPWAISIVLHAGLVTSAGFIAWRLSDSREDSPPITVSFEDPAIAPAMATPPAPATATEPASAAALERILTRPAVAIPDEAPPLPALPEPPTIRTPERARPPEMIPAQTAPRTVEFSGLGASEARDIVYVVDASGSMISSFPDLLTELRRSIDRLHPTQRFQVLLFRSPLSSVPDHTAYTWLADPDGFSKPVLMDAIRRQKAAVYSWLETVTPQMLSNPIPALEAALSLKPDAIFLLSSGATDPSLLGMTPEAALARLDRLNPRRSDGSREVVIRTVQVLEEDPLHLLQRIAQAHGGESGYKFISRTELTSPRPRNARTP